MAAQLEKEESLEPLAAQFVLLKIDTGTAVWPKWNSRYDCEGSGEPKVFVVRGDGKQLYGEVGAPADMDGFLKDHLKDAGKILEPRELNALEKDAKNAQKAMRRKAWAEAVEIVAKEPGKGSYAASVVALGLIAGELADKAKTTLDDAEKKLSVKEEGFDGALVLIEARRHFGGLPAVKELIDQAIARHRDDDDRGVLVAQAEIYDNARQLETQRKWREALAAYQELPDKHPESRAAGLAKKRIPDLEKRVSVAFGGAGASQKSAAADKTAMPDNEKRAASYLKFARQFQKTNPAKAREYCEKVIQAAPDSSAAEEASKLLNGLPKGGSK
jgi:hypothetical protein